MRQLITSIVFFVFFISCTKQEKENKVFFIPELVIGKNSEIDGGYFNTLNSFCVLTNENIYCLDGEDRKIKVFDKTGKKPLFSFGRKGKGPGEFIYPRGIVSNNRFIYVLDAGRRNIAKFTKEGKFLNSVNIEDAVARFDIFHSGNLVLETAVIDRKDVKKSQIKLSLFDGELREVKSSIYEGLATYLTWAEGAPNKIFTQVIPFAPKITWEIIGDRLYVGYNKEYNISVFDANGKYLKKIIKKDIKHEKVTRNERDKWIMQRVEHLSHISGFVPKILEKSLKKIKIPAYKPAFTSISKFSTGFVVFRNPTEKGIPGILYDKNNKEIGQSLFEYDDFKYFYGRYYRITGGDEKPYTLTRYTLAK